MRRLFTLVLSLLLVLPVLAGEVRPTENPFLWMIGEGPPSFVFGTIHLPDERVLALPEVVLEAFDAADVLYTEIPMDMATQMSMAPKLFLPDGKTLKDVLPADLFKRVEAIILSMTGEERARPKILNASRRRRIAAGSGVSVEDVNRLIKQFEQMRKMMKKMGLFSGVARASGMPGGLTPF